MRQPFRRYLITLALVTGVNVAAAGFAAAQDSQQEKLNLNSAQEQAVTRGLANQPTQSVPGFSGQVGSKAPTSETAKSLPSDVQTQVPEAKQLLFIKMADRIVLIDPDTSVVAEVVMTPSTTGSGSSSDAGSASSSAPSGSPSR